MPLTINDDKVWYDEARKLEQVCLHVSSTCNRGQSLLLLSHFESALAVLSRVLREKGIDHQRSALDLSELHADRPAKVWLSHARAFHTVKQLTSTVEKHALEIIVAEHHPMHSRDRELIDRAADLDCNATLTFYFSLDDPLMKHFGSDSVKALFQRLGMAQDECISHSLVSKAIRQAQEKIERTVGRDLEAQSAEDWFKYNLPVRKD